MNKRLFFLIFLAFGAILFLSIFIWQKKVTDSSQTTQLVSPEVTHIPKKVYEYSAWVPNWAKESEVLDSLTNSQGKLKTLLPSWYLLSPDGEVIPQTPDYKDKILLFAKEQDLQILPTIENQFDPNRVTRLLLDKNLQQKLADDLIKIASENSYIGWDLNLEQIDKEDNQKFSEFVFFLKQEFVKNNLVLSVTVHAQTGNSGDWEKSLGHDYQALSSSADFIRVMAYDFNHPNSSPGPITPPEDLRAVLEYVKLNIPQEKIILGLPTYGYDWGEDKAVGLQYFQVMETLLKNNGIWQKDDQNLALKGEYRLDNITHLIWFENSETIQGKVKIASNEFQINNFCFWRLAGEDPAIWKNI